MSIDKVTTRTGAGYVPTTRKAKRGKFSVDGITPVDGAPSAADEESRGQRQPASEQDKQANENTEKKGRIDERI